MRDVHARVFICDIVFLQVYEAQSLSNGGVPPGLVGWDSHGTQLLMDDISCGLFGEDIEEQLSSAPFWSTPFHYGDAYYRMSHKFV